MLSCGQTSLQRLHARKFRIPRAAVAPATRGDFPLHKTINRAPQVFSPEDLNRAPRLQADNRFENR
jgi:hypothetical protein